MEMETIASGLISGALTGGASYGAVRVHLEWHRRDIDRNVENIRSNIKRISRLEESIQWLKQKAGVHPAD